MRIQGNVIPEEISIESYLPKRGFVEVRLRENIEEVSVYDATTEKEITMYEYDEYTILAKSKDGLVEEIEANMSDWITTGRTLEVNESASAVQDMMYALAILGVETHEN